MANDDPKYKAWIEKLPCACCSAAAPSIMHHATGAGVALRASDRDGIPLCWQCHDDLHGHRGFFKRMTRAEKKDWQRAKIAAHNTLYEADEVF